MAEIINTSNRFDNCPMKRNNGSCLPGGGFCTSVDRNVCGAIRQAYEAGKRDAERAIATTITPRGCRIT